MARRTTGRQTRPETPFSLKEASPDDPIYTTGFVIGEMRSMDSSASSREMDSDTSSNSPTSMPDSQERMSLLPPDEGQLWMHRSFEQALSELLASTEPESPEPLASPESTSPDKADQG